MNKPGKKRFIAGAICPSCKAMDTLTMQRVENSDVRECVSCGFTDELKFKQTSKELETRVNTSEEEKAAQTQILKFMDGSTKA